MNIFQTNNTTSKYEYLIVGLGNPGSQYENTRHNAGYLALDTVSKENGFKINKLKFKSLLGEGTINSHNAVFIKPATFMNLSGEAVVAAMNFYKIPIERVIVIYDDISIEPGFIRVRRKGSDGGHNGIKNIIYLTGSDTFPRIKLGVGKKPNPNYDLANWVLSNFKKDEMVEMQKTFLNCSEIISLIMDNKIDEAMNKYN